MKQSMAVAQQAQAQQQRNMEVAAQAQYQHHQSMVAAYGQGGVPSATPIQAGQEPPRAPAEQKLEPGASHCNTDGALPAAGWSLCSSLCCMQLRTALCKHSTWRILSQRASCPTLMLSL